MVLNRTFEKTIENCWECPNRCSRYDVHWCEAKTEGPIHYQLDLHRYEIKRDMPIPDWCPLKKKDD